MSTQKISAQLELIYKFPLYVFVHQVGIILPIIFKALYLSLWLTFLHGYFTKHPLYLP